VISNDQEKRCQQKAEKHRDPKDSLTMHGATLLSIPTSNPASSGLESTTVHLLLKGLAIAQRSYSMFENRAGLPKIYRREGISVRLEEDVA
jgi:hypothetical protein